MFLNFQDKATLYIFAKNVIYRLKHVKYDFLII